MLASLEERSICRELDCFLLSRNNMLEEENLINKVARDVFVKIEEGGLDLFYFYFYFYFIFWFIFLFSIFRTTRVRVDQSCHHISHLIAESQDRSWNLRKFSKRFKNKWCHIIWIPYVGLMDYTWLFRVGCTVVSTDHL